MSEKPVFVATHPRACSTAFERVFMTRRDILQCAHEPFGDAFYYGPERLGQRYADDEAARESSGFAKTTYQDVFQRLEGDASEGKRVFIKDMAYYLMPPDGAQPTLVPSLLKGQTNGAVVDGEKANGHVNGHSSSTNGAVTNGTNGANGAVNGHSSSSKSASGGGGGSDGTGNPTVMPLSFLRQFKWTFLIRHPRRGIPSFYRCCVPPLDEVTGFKDFMPSEAGYAELVRLFDYLRDQGIVGPALAGREGSGEKSSSNGGGAVAHPEKTTSTPITVIDADDLLDKPEDVIRAFCREAEIPFSPDMLTWDDEDNQKYVADAFAKWIGFHNDAIDSTCLSARAHGQKVVTEESENEEWREKYGEEGMKAIRACVDENIPHYDYLKSFAIEF
ncbi:P-loop containing nucleoside triphosphate hydrolase protein [Xylariaceae sp. FL0804]|nr:P-loop containing nucleoside triphosphate hydrolase protein [Xylariaceae sp. FL0804]